jgi:hypothetical protein
MYMRTGSVVRPNSESTVVSACSACLQRPRPAATGAASLTSSKVSEPRQTPDAHALKVEIID